MSSYLFRLAFVLGAAANVWVAYGFAGNHALALTMTLLIAVVYGYGALELHRYRQDTAALHTALGQVPSSLELLDAWLPTVPAPLQNAVRLRIEGERTGLPPPSLTPYLAGLLVMLGMLGTFLGMVVTLNGAVFALEGTADLQAIRTAFSEPIKGLGLAFGTSVAGVATSAMLGLMSAIARRERLSSTQQLDSLIAGTLRRFSLAFQRQEAYKAVQLQADALPKVVEQLQAMAQQMQQSQAQLSAQLLQQQTAFHEKADGTYSTLAQSVDRSLRESLSQAAHVVGDNVRPVLTAAVHGLAQETRSLHQSLVESAEQQFAVAADRFSASAGQMAGSWADAVAGQHKKDAALLQNIGNTLHAFHGALDQKTAQMLAELQQSHRTLQQEQAQADQARLQGWLSALQSSSEALQAAWSESANHNQIRQTEICDALTRTAQEITGQAEQSANRTRAETERLLASSEALIQARVDAEAEWMQAHGQRMDQIAGSLEGGLRALRQDEAERGAAAIERLRELQTDVAGHLTQLGTAMEAPIARLIETASQAPRAAAEVITQMRQSLASSTERENTLLEERSRILETLNTLLEAVNHASQEQRRAIDALVESSAGAMELANQRFSERVDSGTESMAGVARQLAATSIDVSSLGETFGFAMQTFRDANQQLTENLQRLEAALEKSMARSDDQLAYYVAQAREVVDLSVLSQKEIFEELRKLRALPAPQTAGVAHA